MRQRERAALVRLETFVQETVLSHTAQRRWVLEALGEAGGLCTARTVDSNGDVIVCAFNAGHYAPADKPGFKHGKPDGTPGGWHLAGGAIWSDAGTANTLHAVV